MGAEIAGAVAGPVVSSVLGGGGSSSTNSAVGNQVQGAQNASAAYAAAVQQAMAALNQTSGQATSDINNQYSTALNQYAPYNFGGLSAFDRLQEAAGLPTLPGGGSFSLQQALSLDRSNKQSIQSQADAKTALTKDLQNYTSARYVPGTVDGTVTGMQPQSLQDVIKSNSNNLGLTAQNVLKDISGVTNPITLNGGYYKSFAQYAPDIQKDLAAFQTPVKTTALTADQQNLVNGYNNGTLNNLATYNPTQAVGDFLNSPEYQLLFNQGGSTMDPNATVLDRFRASPGYQFSLQQGTAARDASAAAKGMLLSGNQQRDLTTFGTGLGDQEFGNYETNLANTYGNYYNRLAGISGVGGNATSAGANILTNQGNQLSNIQTNLGTQLSQLFQGQGTVNANAQLSAANALASGNLYNAQQSNQLAGGIGNGLSTFLNSNNGQTALNNLFGTSSANNSSANSSSYG